MASTRPDSALPRGKVRCPSCGAKNTDAIKCRICGQDLRDDVERPLTQPTPGSAEMHSARLSGIVLLTLLGVLVVAALALVFGVVSGPQWLTDVRNDIPFLSEEADDGWTAFTEPDARWAAELPITREEITVPFAPSTTGEAGRWQAGLGGSATVPDTVLSITWATVPEVEEEQVEAWLTSAAEQFGAELGGRVTTNEEATFRGLPARRVEVTRLEQGGEVASVDAMFILRRDQLVVLQSRSVYPDHPQFSRLVQDLRFL